MGKIFQYLKSKGLISNNRVQKASINKLSKMQILDVASELTTLAQAKHDNSKKSIFPHCASLSLSGSREECFYLGCRQTRLEHLARFATLYSDRVYIRNHFSDYEHLGHRDADKLKQIFSDDLHLILHIQPLLEKGYLVFWGGTEHLCPDCLASAIGIGQGGGERFKKALARLKNDYFENTSFSLEHYYNHLMILAKGPTLYHDHGDRVILLNKLPKIIKAKPKLIKKFEKDGKLLLSRSLSKKLNYHLDMANEVAKTINYEVLANILLNTSFLTDKEIHLSFLKTLSGDQEIEQRNSIAFKHLTTIVPFVEDVELKYLIKLRNREEESFMQFRMALNKSIDEFRTSKGTFSEREAQSLYSDVIAPELARLNRNVKDAKKDLVSSAMRSFVGTVGAISFGLYSGIVPAEWAAIANALGFTTFGADMIQKMIAFGDSRKAIRHEDLYFLWKVKHLARKA